MTEQQQNILELFKNNNRELAEVLVIASGNEQWFKEEIIDKISKLYEIMNKYGELRLDYKFSNSIPKEHKELFYLQVLLNGIYIEPLYEEHGDCEFTYDEIWIDNLIINGCEVDTAFVSDHEETIVLEFKKELEEFGIKVTII